MTELSVQTYWRVLSRRSYMYICVATNSRSERLILQNRSANPVRLLKINILHLKQRLSDTPVRNLIVYRRDGRSAIVVPVVPEREC